MTCLFTVVLLALTTTADAGPPGADGCCATPHSIAMSMETYAYLPRSECTGEGTRWVTGPECEPVCCGATGGGAEQWSFRPDTPRGACAYFCCGVAQVEMPDVLCQGEVTGRTLNDLGFEAYKAGDMVEAARMFSMATDQDPELAIAWYNLACAQALLRRAGKGCDHDLTLAGVLSNLERSVELDSRRRERMRADSDMDDVRGTIWYRVLDGADLADSEVVSRMLVESTFPQVTDGDHGPTAKLVFAADGTVRTERLTPTVTVTPGEETTLTVVRPQQGTWTAEAGAVVVDVAGKAVRYELTERGELVRDGEVKWAELAGECASE